MWADGGPAETPWPRPPGHISGPLHSQTSFPRPVPISPFPGVCFLAPAGICPPESHRAPRASLVICRWAWPPPHQTLTSPRRQSYQVWTASSPCPASSKPRILPIPGRAEEGQAPLGLSMAVTCQIWSDHRPRGLRAQPGGPESGRKLEVYVSVNQEQSRGCAGPDGREGGQWPEKHSSSPAWVPPGAQSRTADHRGDSILGDLVLPRSRES